METKRSPYRVIIMDEAEAEEMSNTLHYVYEQWSQYRHELALAGKLHENEAQSAQQAHHYRNFKKLQASLIDIDY